MKAIRVTISAAMLYAALCVVPAAQAASSDLWRDGPRFVALVRSTLQGKTGHYFYEGRVADQVMEGLGGPPDPMQDLGGDAILISGCRFDSCPEKAAIIVGPGERIQGAALLHFRCQSDFEFDDPQTGKKTRLWTYCNKPLLALFIPLHPESDRYRQALMDWAQSKDFWGQVNVRFFEVNTRFFDQR